MTTNYQDLIRLQGGRPPVAPVATNKLVPGPFIFAATLPDNATTEQDLTAQAALVDKQLIDMFGDAADIPAMLHVERIGVIIQEDEEVPADLTGIVQYLYMRWKSVRANGEKYFTLAPYILGGTARAVAAGATAELTAIGLNNIVAQLRDLPPLPNPLLIDLNKDTWAVGLETAVDTAAAVPSLYIVDGWAYPRSDDAADIIQDCYGSPAAVERQVKRSLDARAIRTGLRG